MKILKVGPAAWAASGSVALLAALTVAPTVSSASNGAGPHPLRQHDSHSAGASGSSSNLIDHTGPVLPNAVIYTIWWGSTSYWNSTTVPEMTAFFGGLNGSSYVATGKQYMRGATPAVSYGGSATDSSTPTRQPSTSSIGAEVQKEINNGALPADKNGIYFVFTSNFPSRANYCAWHSYTSISAGRVAIAYMPNVTGISGCNAVQASGISTAATSYSDEGTLSLANVTAHEFMESITDPGLSAWYDSSGSEIGDKCAWQFDGTVQLTGGKNWILQKEWSNSISGCTETTP